MNKTLSLVLLVGFSMVGVAHAEVQTVQANGKNLSDALVNVRNTCYAAMKTKIVDKYDDGIETKTDITSTTINSNKSVSITAICEGNLRDNGY